MKRFRVVPLLHFLLVVVPLLLALMALHFWAVKHYYNVHIASGRIDYWTDEEGMEENTWSVFTMLAASLLVWPGAAVAAIFFGLRGRVPGPWRGRSLRGQTAREARLGPPTATAVQQRPTLTDFSRDRRNDGSG